MALCYHEVPRRHGSQLKLELRAVVASGATKKLALRTGLQRCGGLEKRFIIDIGMGCVWKMRGLVMLMAAVSLFAASVSACACPTHSHAAKPKPEKTSCHSHSDQDASETSNSLAAGCTCHCGDAAQSPAITPKPEKRTSVSEQAAEAVTIDFRPNDPQFRAAQVIEHPPPELSGYNRLRFANLPSRAPPRLLS